MQIPEMFSYDGMKDEVLLIHNQRYNMEERVKTEHNLATQNIKIIIIIIFAPFAFTSTFIFNT